MSENKKEKIGITIRKDIWKKMCLLKIEKDIRTFDELIEYLLEKESNA